MDKEYMRNYYRRMYENPCDFVIADSEEFEEKKKIRYALEDKLEEMMGEQPLCFIKCLMNTFLHIAMKWN